jgi:periplasmic protein TonB
MCFFGHGTRLASMAALPVEQRTVRGADPAAGHAIPISFGAADRPAPHFPPRQEYWPLIGLLICSVLMHANLAAIFTTAPEALPSIGIPAISVEIVVGDDAPAGVAAAPGQEGPVQARQEATPQEQETAPPQDAVSVARSAESKPIAEDAARPQETHPTTDVAAVSEPKQAVSGAPESPAVPLEPEPIVSDDRPKAPEVEPAPPPQTAGPPKPEPVKPVKADEAPKPDVKQPTLASAPASQSASGISQGRSAADANYSARVAAHLARHKQFPAEARRRGQKGSASISFNIDGSGWVTDVRLVGSAGFRILDREAQSMVRRASPFPPPPDGQPRSFSVPVSFSMR